jgi:hypothetical protein
VKEVFVSRWIVIGAAGVTLTVVAAIAAYALAPDDSPGVAAEAAKTTAVVDESGGDQRLVESRPPMTRHRLHVHAETGPPDGIEPVRQQLRIHRQDDLPGMGRFGGGAGRGPGR